MKSKIKILIILVTISVFSLMFARPVTAQPGMSFQVFYDQLSPYGQWVEDANDGYVWIPDAGPDFMPYSTMGHWIYTDFGWTWASDYPWGWAPFHYGRWDFNYDYGWFWIPDTQWGPAWVSWRRAEGYYGWEPMGPGISLSVSFNRGYDSRNDHWMFVRDRDFDRADVNHYYVNRSENERIVRSSTVIINTSRDNRRNTTYVTGPNRNDIQKVTGRRVSQITVQENSRPGQVLNKNKLSIYRPVVTRIESRDSKPAPSRITNIKDVKHPAERRSSNMPGNGNQRGSENDSRTQGTVKPQNNTVNPTQSRDGNSLRNNSRGGEQNNNAKPVQQQITPPVRNNTNLPRQNNEVRPVQQQNTPPVKNNANVQQQNNVNQQNAKASKQNTRAERTKTVKPTRNRKKGDNKTQETTQDVKK